jgi:hypothetical protein
MTTPSRKAELRRRRTRIAKLKLLRKRYAAARSEADRKTILEKLGRLSPLMTKEEFLKPLGAES